MNEGPKYPVGTLLLSNIPYSHGENKRDRELGMIIYTFEKPVPFTNIKIWMYVVEWNSAIRRTPVSYTVDDIDCFINNLKKYG